MPVFQFVKSSYSNVENDCVEVARNVAHTVAVRDSKISSGPVLLLTPTTWHAFIHSPWTR
ncbi:DUF397 domain-containing protein [Streptomyces acidiscabies]|uniref:DUF397 domain-containing protein n=1 Tax=Streptomyces acidiscabies TaxID=42234 RepID=A0A0L0KFV6_9ACTN|nr:DUF397 domain-containing protein [Streptomyces acidiscabies]KND36540.1 hypothetical protein IQ63_12405 [Streptomyces acidiscabies]